MSIKTKVLIIDDEEPIRRSLATFFEEYGYQVALAQNGQEGIDKAREERFDLILLDLYMPEMTGMEALPALRTLNPESRVVILTGQGTYESKVEAEEHGIYDYLLKPIKLGKIKEVIDRALSDKNRDAGQSDTGQVDLASIKINPEAVHEISLRIAQSFCLIAIEKDEHTLTVAMVDPKDIVALDTVKAHTNFHLRPVKADRREILKAIRDMY